MKDILKISLLATLGSILLFSCLKDVCDESRTFVQFDPIYLSYDEIRADVSTESPRELENPGKLYVFGKYLYINEFQKGVHIYDNSDPRSPTSIGFINIPGNVDVAIKDGFMYADNYMDILTIDVNDPLESQVICRDEDVYTNYYFQESRGVLVGYRETEITAEVDCNDPNFNQDRFFVDDVIFGAPEFDLNSSLGNNTRSSTGTGGSLARFSIVKDHLYVIDDFNMYIYDVGKPEKPRRANDFYVEWGIETLFSYGDNLFIGANNGMHIYSIKDAKRPQYMSVFRHATACDPVFVDDDIAYVTLRDGRECESFSNQLDVIDVSDLRNPELLKSFQMDNPQGLSVRNDRLYLCERDFGLKVFDSSEPKEVGDKMKKHLKNIHASDVIALSDDLLLVIGEGGLHQFDISDRDDPQELSVITAVNGQ